MHTYDISCRVYMTIPTHKASSTPASPGFQGPFPRKERSVDMIPFSGIGGGGVSGWHPSLIV